MTAEHPTPTPARFDVGSIAPTTVLVTGGAGFIGGHLVERLVRDGHEVRVLDDLSTGRTENLAAVRHAMDFRQGSLTDPAAVASAVEGVELIYHQAALASVQLSVEEPTRTHAACVTGTVELLDAARRAGVRRVVYAGSSAAYGNQPTAANREADLPAPLSPYAAAKLAAEHYVRAFGQTFGVEAVTLRYFNVFGPRQDPRGPYAAVIPIFINRMLAGRRPVIFGDGTQTRDFTYVANVVEGNILAGFHPAASGEVFNLAMGASTTLLDLVAVLNDVLGTDLEPEFQPARLGEVKDSMADITRLRAVLDYRPAVDFRTGLAETVAAYRENLMPV